MAVGLGGDGEKARVDAAQFEPFTQSRVVTRLCWVGGGRRGAEGVSAKAAERREPNGAPQACSRLCELVGGIRPSEVTGRRGGRDDARALVFTNRHLSRGWNGWYALWSETVAAREAMARSISHMLNRGLSMGWHGWMEMVEERHEAIGLLRKGVGFMQNRGLAIGFNGWMDAYAGQLGLDLSRRAMARAIKYLLNKGLARGFNGIKAIWDEALLLRETGRKRRQLHREIVKAQRMAANLYTQGQSSEFLARSASDAKMVRLRKDIAEDRRHNAYGPRLPPRPSSASQFKLEIEGATTPLQGRPAVAAFGPRPDSAGLARSKSEAGLEVRMPAPKRSQRTPTTKAPWTPPSYAPGTSPGMERGFLPTADRASAALILDHVASMPALTGWES